MTERETRIRIEILINGKFKILCDYVNKIELEHARRVYNEIMGIVQAFHIVDLLTSKDADDIIRAALECITLKSPR